MDETEGKIRRIVVSIYFSNNGNQEEFLDVVEKFLK